MKETLLYLLLAGPTLLSAVSANAVTNKYETAFDYFPTALVTQGRVDARIDHGRMYLETQTVALKASVIGQHQATSDMLAQSAR